MRRTWILLGLTLALTPAACGDDVVEKTDPCNPLGGQACLLPWPSSAYLVTDATSATGYRVSLPIEGMPVNIDEIPIDPTRLNRHDGFSPNAVIVAAFPTGVSPVGLPPHTDIAGSVGADSSILILNMETGERVPLFAEVDLNTEDVTQRALLIRPLARMAEKTRHLVAIRKSVTAPDGTPLPIPPAFQAMLDGVAFDHPLMEKLAPGYPAIFAALQAEGIAKSDLVLAWDFVTASNEFLTSDLLAMRDRALPLMANNAEDLTFSGEIAGGVDKPTEVYRYLVGTHDAPMFLSNGELDDSIIVRGADGLPEVQGTYRAEWAAIIPACVATTRPIPVIVFGHGLFGNAKNTMRDTGFLHEVANDHCVVFIAGDWIGLTNEQIADTANAVNDINKAPGITEKLGQAVINFMALSRLVRGPMAADPLFQYEGEPVLDPTRVHYYGASLGGIMGNVFMAYEPDIELGALGVPGGNWTLMMERSLAWPPLQSALRSSYEDPLEAELNISLFGMGFDPFDPITTSYRVVNDPLPGVPAKKIFLYEGVGDTLVTNLATEMVAREMRIPVTGPSLYVPYGLTETTDVVGSALTIYDEHREPVPDGTNVAPVEDNGTHSNVNERDAVMNQVKRFFLDGELAHTCAIATTPAPCDCSTGACDNPQ
jgi:hypothetical protein